MVVSTSIVQNVTARAQRIQSSLADGFKIDDAKHESEALYQDGVRLAIAEFQGQPLTNDILSSVVTVLNDVVPAALTQHSVPFHRALSKTYRIFIELTWYQCWRQRSLPIFKDTREAIITNAKKPTQTLPKDEGIDIRFEYRCAKQAAQCLTPTESIWKKYFDHILELGEAAEGGSVLG